MRATLAVATLVLLAAACSGPATDGTEASLSSTSTFGTPSTAQTTSAPTTTVVEATTTTSGRPVAPDFTLQLGNGGQYMLSAGARPVYLVFWAEW